MLVITRRLNESILVGDNVRIVILGIDGDRIKIGIEAPASLKILRAELFAEVRDVNREAIVTDLAGLQNLLGQAEGVKPVETVEADTAVSGPSVFAGQEEGAVPSAGTAAGCGREKIHQEI